MANTTSLRRWSAATTAVVAAGCLSMVDGVAHLVSGAESPIAYPVLVATLGIVPTFLLGVAFGRWRAAMPCLLAAWSAMELLVRTAPSGKGLVLATAAVPVLAWVLAGLRSSPPWMSGLTAAAIVAVSAHSSPWFSAALLGRPSHGASLAITLATALLLHVAVRLASSRAEASQRWIALLSFIVLVTVPALTESAPPSRLAPDRETAAAGTLPNVIVLILDTVAAEHLSLYGYERATSPSLERFVASHPRATVYPLAFSVGSWTVPSHVSLLTGLLPSDHGATEESFFSVGDVRIPRLRADWWLAAALHERGYRTAGIFANVWLDMIPGLGTGFELWFQPPFDRRISSVGDWLQRHLLSGFFADRFKPYPAAYRVNAGILAALDSAAEAPIFVLANYMEAHPPFRAPAPFLGRFGPITPESLSGIPGPGDDEEIVRQYIDRYDEAICALDESIGNLLEELDARGVLDEAWLFITADHGEAFGRHEVTGHGSSLYNDQVRVPLIVHPPKGVELVTRSSAVGLMDITATVAAVAGIAPPAEGLPLSSPMTREHLVPMEFFGRPWLVKERGALAGRPARAVAVGTRKWLEIAGRVELFDLANDPDELSDIAGDSPISADLLDSLPPLRLRATATGEAVDTNPSKTELELLRSLGYVE